MLAQNFRLRSKWRRKPAVRILTQASSGLGASSIAARRAGDRRATGKEKGLHKQTLSENGGAREDRTPDLVIANDALSQLSYGPMCTATRRGCRDVGKCSARYPALPRASRCAPMRARSGGMRGGPPCIHLLDQRAHGRALLVRSSLTRPWQPDPNARRAGAVCGRRGRNLRKSTAFLNEHLAS